MDHTERGSLLNHPELLLFILAQLEKFPTISSLAEFNCSKYQTDKWSTYLQTVSGLLTGQYCLCVGEDPGKVIKLVVRRTVL